MIALRELEFAISLLEDDFDAGWQGRATRVHLDVIASSLVRTMLPKRAAEAPSLEDVLGLLASRYDRELAKQEAPTGRDKDALSTLVAVVNRAVKATEELLEQCALWDYGLDDPENDDDAIEKLNALRTTIHQALLEVVNVHKERKTTKK